MTSKVEYMTEYNYLVKTYPDIRMANLILDLKFKGILDKGGKEYKKHCIRVAMKFEIQLKIDEIVAALLHDIVEDTDVTCDDLENNGFSDRTIWLISMLTKNKRLTYKQNIVNICNSNDFGLMLIKLADNIDNKNPHRLHYLSNDEFKSLDKRYDAVRPILLDGISLVKKDLKLDLEPLDF
jgi:(p)ppGpp synthase/HD superfamily hydrolase